MVSVNIHGKEHIYLVRDSSGDITVYSLDDFNKLMYDVCKTISFADCTGDEIVAIISEGQTLHYVGWQPDMLFEFTDDWGNIVASEYFPQFEH